MAETVADLVAILRADTAQFQGAMAKAEAQMATTKTGASNFGKVASTALVVAGVAAVAFVAKSVDAFVKWGAEVLQVQRVTGLAAEEASGLAATAAALGMSVQQLSVGFGILSRNIINNATNFAKYHLEVKDASGAMLPFGTILGNIADRFNSLGSQQEKVAFAMNVFGRSGKSLIPILSLGSAGIAEFEARAKSLGLVMSQQDVDAARKFAISGRELGETFKGLTVTIGRVFLPLALNVIHIVTDVVGAFGKLPAPVLEAGLGFVIFTGAVATAFKIAAFFTGTIGKLTLALGLKTAAETADAGSAALATGAAAAEAGATARLTLAIERNTAMLYMNQRGIDASIVSMDAYIATAAKMAESSAAAGVAAGASVPVIAAKVGLLAGIIAKARAVIFSPEAAMGALAYFTIGAGTTAPVSQPKRIEQQVSAFGTLQRSAALGSAGGGLSSSEVGPLLKNARDLALAAGADAKAFDLATSSSISYAAALKQLGIAPAVADLNAASAAVTTLTSSSMAGLDSLQKWSGTNVDAIKASIQALDDPKLQSDPVKFLGAAQAALKSSTDAWNAWHDSITQAFGGASAAMSQFVGKTNVSFAQMKTSLDQTQAQTKAWQSAFSTILAAGGEAAKTFLNDMSKQGLGSLGMLQAVAKQPANIRAAFLREYGAVNKAQGTLATQIQNALDPAFKIIETDLQNIINAILGIPQIDLNIDPAMIKLGVFKNGILDALALARSLGVGGGGGGTGGGGHGSVGGNRHRKHPKVDMTGFYTPP